MRKEQAFSSSAVALNLRGYSFGVRLWVQGFMRARVRVNPRQCKWKLPLQFVYP